MARTWLVTGGSRGFGRALCEGVLDAGDNLVATARDRRSSHRSVSTTPLPPCGST
jgi:NAD(P)-dependent dehydrogenase (short-subunit alcohol dehydrogenase family)